MASNVDMKLLRQTKFPPEFNKKVDMNKVNLEVMKKWIAGKISEILGSEDDVVIELCFNLLEGSRFPEIKKLQISLTGFLDKDTPKFCKELWTLCLSAQSNPQGVPKELLEAKKLELIQEKVSQLSPTPWSERLLKILGSLTQRRQQRKQLGRESRKRADKRTWTRSGSANEEDEVGGVTGVVMAEVEEALILKDFEVQEPLQDVAGLLTGLITEGLR
ncbi:MAG: hypothetical protein M1837_004525 [Sclerophora amabilis]|nr:MAG: hypothetical protein M1837_004525 [Sclerophora amabilis]